MLADAFGTGDALLDRVPEDDAELLAGEHFQVHPAHDLAIVAVLRCANTHAAQA